MRGIKPRAFRLTAPEGPSETVITGITVAVKLPAILIKVGLKYPST